MKLFKNLSHFQQIIMFMVGFGILFLAYSDAVRRQWDFAVYYLAAKGVWEEINIYNSDQMMAYADTIDGVGYAGLPFLYPPLVARLLFPFGWLDYFNAAFMWMVLKCLALEFSIFMILKLIRLNRSVISLTLVHLGAIFFQPIGLDFNSGNVAIFELTFLLSFFYFWREKQYFISGISILLSSLMKIYPILLVLYPLHLRDRRFLWALSISVLSVASLQLLDFQDLQRYLVFFRSPFLKLMWDEQVQSFYNCSYMTVILRNFSATYFAIPLYESPILVSLLIPMFPILIFATMAFVIWMRQKDMNFKPLNPGIISFLLCGVLLLTPRLAGYTLAWTFFSVVFLVCHSLKKTLYLPLIIALIGIVLFQLYLPPQHIPSGVMQLLVDKEFFALLCLFIANVIVVLRDKQSNEDFYCHEGDYSQPGSQVCFYTADNNTNVESEIKKPVTDCKKMW